MQSNYLQAKQADTHEHIQIEVLTPTSNNDSPTTRNFQTNYNDFKTEPDAAKNSEDFPLVAKGYSPTSPPIVKSLYEKKAVTLTFKDLSYSVLTKNDQKKNNDDPKYVRREILRGMTGICKPRQLTAIMGSSGAGKTTLLNILSMRATGTKNNKLSGEFLANGQKYDIGKFSKFAGYVMQNDILFETMTPREILTFTANLRLTGSAEEKKRKVNQLLIDLKLERAADTIVGGPLSKGISGGERKRASIGVELITDPHLIFLDEPTSGLDSFTAFILISLLKNLAVRGGKTIVFTIHQPSSDTFFLFDNLMVLAKGKFIYQGPTPIAVDYFAAIGYQCPEYTNPADYFIEIAHSNAHDDTKFHRLYDSYSQEIAPKIQKEITHVSNKELVLAEQIHGFFDTAKLIARRSLINTVRNPVLLIGQIAQTLFLCFLSCCLFFKITDNDNESRVYFDINGSLFFFSICMFALPSITCALTFPSERPVFLREYSANMYSVSAYYFGRSSTEIPFVVIFPVLMTVICYYIIGYNESAGKFFIFMLISVVMSVSGNAVGLTLGSVISDAKVVPNVVPTIILPFMIFSGFFINSSSMPVWLRWLQYISPFRYSLESYMWNEYSHSSLGTSTLDEYDYHLGLWGSFGILVAIGIVVRVIALFTLKRLVSKLE